MTIYRTDRNQVFNRQGQMLSEQVVQVDVTAEVTSADIESKARSALASNVTYLGLGSPTNAQVAAQVRALTRQINGLIRLRFADLLVENTDT